MPKREDEFWARQKELQEKELREQESLRDSFSQDNEVEQASESTEATNISYSESKAWFGNEYYDKKTGKWKKPGIKTRTIIASVIALVVVIAIVALIVYYGLNLAE